MPYPSSIGGGKMGYPSTVDAGGVAPFTLETPDTTVLTNTAITAGKAYFTAVTTQASVIISQMRCSLSGSPTGNIDLGIYDASGSNNAPNNLLGHTGAIAATTGVFTQSLTSLLTLSPGQYWLAIVDTVADTIAMRSSIAAQFGVCMQTSASNLTVLPSTAGTVTDSILRAGLIALVSGGWS